MFLIDTDVLSALAKRRCDANVEDWIERWRTTDLFISVISVGEIERGIALQRGKDQQFAAMLALWLDHVINLYGDRVLPFDLAAARRWDNSVRHVTTVWTCRSPPLPPNMALRW